MGFSTSMWVFPGFSTSFPSRNRGNHHGTIGNRVEVSTISCRSSQGQGIMSSFGPLEVWMQSEAGGHRWKTVENYRKTGGWWLEHDFYFPFHIWECHHPLSDFHSIIFQRGRWLNHQPAGIGTLGVDPQVWSRMNYLEVTFEKPWSDVGNFIIPTDEITFFRGVGIPPTRLHKQKTHMWDFIEIAAGKTLAALKILSLK